MTQRDYRGTQHPGEEIGLSTLVTVGTIALGINVYDALVDGAKKVARVPLEARGLGSSRNVTMNSPSEEQVLAYLPTHDGEGVDLAHLSVNGRTSLARYDDVTRAVQRALDSGEHSVTIYGYQEQGKRAPERRPHVVISENTSTLGVLARRLTRPRNQRKERTPYFADPLRGSI